MSSECLRWRLPTALALSAAALSGCSSESAPAPAPGPEANAGGPTFSSDVAPILQKRCIGCHSEGSIAPFSLTTYADAKAVSAQIVAQTTARKMPPYSSFSTDECQPRNGFREDLHLSSAEIQTLSAWDAAGAKEGEPGAALSPPPRLDTLSDSDVELAPQKPFVVSGEGDKFRCFVLDPKLSQATYVNGQHFIAGNPAIVHHVLAFVDPNRESAAKMDADGGYECFGGPGVNNPTLLGGWAPGMGPVEYGPDIGALLPQNALIVMQVHYHSTGVTSASDTTKLALRFNKDKPKYQLDFMLAGNAPRQFSPTDGLLPGPNDQGGIDFRIPANTAGHIERMRFTIPSVPVPVHVYGAAHHMHYLGTDMKTTIEHVDPTRSEPKEECILQTPQWDFTWQRFYFYDAPIEKLPEIRAGDSINLRCTYDNTAANPFLKRALAEQHLSSPVDVRLGESTLDEMCLVALPLIHLSL